MLYERAQKWYGHRYIMIRVYLGLQVHNDNYCTVTGFTWVYMYIMIIIRHSHRVYLGIWPPKVEVLQVFELDKLIDT